MMTDKAIAKATTENPTDDQIRDWVKRSMFALTRLMVGRKGDPHGKAFNREVMVIVGGQLPPLGALWLADVAQLNRRHVIHLSPGADHALPEIAVAYRQGDSVEVAENCLMCLMPGQDRVLLVPDSFTHGAYAFSASIRLRRRNAPASFDAARADIRRAYARYFDHHAAMPHAAWEPLRFGRR